MAEGLAPVSRPPHKGHCRHAGRVARTVEGAVGVGVQEQLAGAGRLGLARIDHRGLTPAVILRERAHLHYGVVAGYYSLAPCVGGEHAVDGRLRCDGVHYGLIHVIFGRVGHGEVRIAVGGIILLLIIGGRLVVVVPGRVVVFTAYRYLCPGYGTARAGVDDAHAHCLGRRGVDGDVEVADDIAEGHRLHALRPCHDLVGSVGQLGQLQTVSGRMPYGAFVKSSRRMP